MVSHIVLKICSIAAALDQHTAYRLCLTSRTINKLTTPFLYSNVSINSPKAALILKRTIVASSRLAKMIKMITVDYIPYDKEEQVAKKFLSEGGDVRNLRFESELMNIMDAFYTKRILKHNDMFNSICWILRHLGKRFGLVSLTLLGKVSVRFANCALNSFLSLNKIKLDHFVLCAPKGKEETEQELLKCFLPKRLTYYGCSQRIGKQGYFQDTLIKNSQLEQVNIMIGSDARKVYGSRNWRYSPMGLDRLFNLSLASIQAEGIKVNLLLHRRSPGMKERIEKELQRDMFKRHLKNVSIGVWGHPSDLNEEDAERRSIKMEEWKEPMGDSDGDIKSICTPTQEEKKGWRIGNAIDHQEADQGGSRFHPKSIALIDETPDAFKCWDGRKVGWCQSGTNSYEE